MLVFQAFRGGRLTTAWAKPLAFLEAVAVEYAPNGRSRSKADKELIAKGELRVVFNLSTAKHFYRPAEAAAFLRHVKSTVKEAKGFKFEDLAGVDDLESDHRTYLLQVPCKETVYAVTH